MITSLGCSSLYAGYTSTLPIPIYQIEADSARTGKTINTSIFVFQIGALKAMILKEQEAQVEVNSALEMFFLQIGRDLREVLDKARSTIDCRCTFDIFQMIIFTFTLSRNVEGWMGC
jgi:hypothetical protein